MWISLYSIFFGCWLWINIKQYKFNLSSLLLLFYLSSTVAAVLLLFVFGKYEDREISFESSVYLILCLFLCLSPVVKFGNKYSSVRRLSDIYKYENVLYILACFCILTIVMRIPDVIRIIKSEDFLLERLNFLNKEQHTVSIIDYISAIGEKSVFLLIVMYFYYKVSGRKKIISILLFICLFSPIFQAIAKISRSVSFSYIVYLLFCYLLFRRNFSIYTKKIVKITSIFLLFIIILFVYKVTDNRFVGYGEGIMVPILDYWGQSFINFSRDFDYFFNGYFWGRLNFRFLFPASMQVPNMNLSEVYGFTYDVNVFSTMIGSFYMDFGIFTFFVCVCINLFLNALLNTNLLKNYFLRFYLYIIFWHASLLGIFYYVLSSRTEVLCILCVVLLILFFNPIKRMINEIC